MPKASKNLMAAALHGGLTSKPRILADAALENFDVTPKAKSNKKSSFAKHMANVKKHKKG